MPRALAVPLRAERRQTGSMSIGRLLAGVIASVALLVGTSGCAPAEVQPVVVELADLGGQTIEVPLDSELIIITDWTLVDTYSAVIADPDVAEFQPGADTGDAAFSPRFFPLEVGETAVLLSGEDDDVANVEFTIEVVAVGR